MKTRLRVLRAEKEWSQAALAARRGSVSRLHQLHRNRPLRSSLPLAFKIARAFGKNVKEVFLYQDGASPNPTGSPT